jgi:hypothetical protein
MLDPTYDPVTQTVADDIEGRVSVFDLDDCPACGGPLTHCPGSLGGGIDQVLCLNTACRFSWERETPMLGSAVDR